MVRLDFVFSLLALLDEGFYLLLQVSEVFLEAKQVVFLLQSQLRQILLQLLDLLLQGLQGTDRRREVGALWTEHARELAEPLAAFNVELLLCSGEGLLVLQALLERGICFSEARACLVQVVDGALKGEQFVSFLAETLFLQTDGVQQF